MGKKLMAVLLALCVALTFAGCKNGQQEKTTEAPVTTQDTTGTETTEAASTPAAWMPTADDISYMTNDNGYLTGIKASDYIDLPDFSTVTFLLDDYTPTDVEIETELEAFAETCADENQDASYTIVKGDQLLIDYVGKFNGEAFQGGTASNVQIEAGGVGYIDDFQDQLIGHHPGETFDIEVTFPVPYPNNPDYAGKDATFTITIHSVLTIPELTDEFIASHDMEVASYFGTADVKTVDELKDYIRQSVLEYDLNSALQKYAYSQELKEYPENLMEIGRKMIDVIFYMSYQINIEDVYTQLGYSEEDMDNFSRGEIQTAVFYQAIAEKEGWEITKDDLSEITGTEDNDELIANFGQGYIARKLIEKRGVEYLREHCDIH